MSFMNDGHPWLSGRRRVLATEIQRRLRELNSRLSVLNHVVGARLQLRDVDLDCLDLIQREGPITPSRLAARCGLHPATMTGILDRLQRVGWVTRERDPELPDRRAVQVRIGPGRAAEVFRQYDGMLTAMDRICSRYTTEELHVLGDFLDRVAAAARDAVEDLTAQDPATQDPATRDAAEPVPPEAGDGSIS
jgi:DNA-binding MarR family transcriptional regulator